MTDEQKAVRQLERAIKEAIEVALASIQPSNADNVGARGMILKLELHAEEDLSTARMWLDDEEDN